MTNKKWISFKERRELKQQQEALDTYGLVLRAPDSQDLSSLKARLFVCIIRSILIFMLVFGTLGGTISAFGLSYNPFIVIPALMIVSVCISFLYYNRITFYLGYIALFISFTISSIAGYFYINSGFQAIVNVIYEKYSDYFWLKSVRESTEFITDRYLTVSLAMVFAGAFLAILLNITISGYMSLIETFLLTFPILEIALYIDLQPGIGYLLSVFLVYITVGILHRSGHFKMSDIKNSKKAFLTNRKKDKNEYSYMSEGLGMIYTAIYAFIFAAIFLIITSGIFYRDYDSRVYSNKLKDSTDEMIRTYVQNGAWAFFDRYASSGGLNQGKLGGVSRVNPDYETDLVATFVPLSTDTIYLKGFIGNEYTGNSFSPDTALDSRYPNASYNPSSKYSLSEGLHFTNTFAKMQIENIDVGNIDVMPYDSHSYKYKGSIYDSHYSLYPNTLNVVHEYADKMLDEEPYESTADGKITEIIYTPYIPENEYPDQSIVSDDYEDFVYQNYLSIPDELESTLESVCDEAGLYDIKDADSAKERFAILRALQTFYRDEFSYTMAPGATPFRKDVVEHFLTTRRKGFCAHFASSATLLLRKMGIPSRYVEGYCIQLTNIIDDGKAVTDDLTGWINDDTDMDTTDLGVITLEISDGNAHAWVEVYIDGYGWIPYEFTPPSLEAMSSGNSMLADIFRSLVIVSDSRETTNNNANNLTNAYNFNFAKSFGFIAWPMLIVLAATIFILTIIYLGKPIIDNLLISIYSARKDYRKAITISYMRLINKEKHKLLKQNIHYTLDDYMEYFINSKQGQLNPSQIELLTSIVKKTLYSSHPVTAKEYKSAKEIIKLLKAKK